VTSGGRVLGVTAWGKDLRGARDAAYAAVETICFEGAHFRRDIGSKGLRYNQRSFTKI
jgi:phosphoribosylamine--glycine ligase